MNVFIWKFRKVACLIILSVFLLLTLVYVYKNLNNKNRILCMVTTHPKNHKTRANAVKNTWGQRCDVLYFVSSESDPSYPIIDIKCNKENHNHLWCKNRKGLIYGYNNFMDDFDWFVKADDDTYIIIENLKYLLSHYDTNEPLLFGMPFKYQNVTYPSGGAGYIFSKEAISRLVNKLTDQKTNRKECHTNAEIGADDFDIGRCLKGLDVTFVDTRDSLGRGRFFPFQPYQFLNPNANVYDLAWFKNYSIYFYKQGFECCSDDPVSFHYIYAPDMYVLEYFIYKVNLKF